MKKAAVTLLLAALGVTVPAWKDVDRLVSEQKLEEASRAAAEIRAAARKSGDETEETRALIREVQLRTALHGYETAVRFLREEPWPKGLRSRTVLSLFYARSLVVYTQAYGWEIGQREKVDTKGVVDLKAWTREQLFAEAARAFAGVWKEREALGREPGASLAEFVETNTYPPGVRPTVRDVAAYLFVELLADTGGWSPDQSNELFALDLPGLVAGNPAASAALRLDDPAVHPLVRMGAVLDDLEAWHRGRREREAELEARLERLRRVHSAFSSAQDRDLIRKDLAARLPAFRAVPWWAMGQAELAEMTRAAEGTGNLVRARALALEGERAYPDAVGGRRCRSIVAGIEAPSWQLAAMAADGAGKRSVEVTHRNLSSLYFRAYALDLEKRLASARDYNLLPAYRELNELVATGTPSASWSVELPPTPDYKPHRTFVTPPMTAPGLYAVVASQRPDFAREPNQVLAADVLVTDLVLAVRSTEAGGLEVRAVAGRDGSPVEAATISLWEYDWQKGHHRVATAPTGRDGLAAFAGRPGGGSYFVAARKGADLALDPSYLGLWRPQPPGETTSALLYTDRSIYRPLQKILWKAVVYRGRSADARFATLPETPLAVLLLDGNGQKVEEAQVKTNAYGTAAGEFAIPAGRLLGSWRVTTSVGGSAAVRVEEYKRPTFEVMLKEPAQALRLNRPATLRGEAAYYFGLPVANGSVRWRVTREPVWPWRWGFLGWGGGRAQAQTVAAGTAPLSGDGTFEFTFTPKADERAAAGTKNGAGVTWRYAATADVTDEGGETRSADRRFRLGAVAVEARMSRDTAFFREGEEAAATLLRTDLDGAPRAGRGTWRLVRLSPPPKTVLPADFPAAEPGDGEGDLRASSAEGDAAVLTPGDRLRPRWETRFSAEEWMRGWKDGAEVARGEAAHDAKGEASAAFGRLPAGAYRLRYETADDFGARFTFSDDVIVASKDIALPLPALLLAESSSVPVGGTARFLALSGIRGQTLYLDVSRAGRPVSRRILSAGKDAALIEIPVTEADRGGFGVTLLAVRDHQPLQPSQLLFVPWDDRELNVSFATFRDRLRPGQKESWRVTVTGAAPEHPLTETAELLAYMYDRSLDAFAPHQPPSPLSLYPNRASALTSRISLGRANAFHLESSLPAAPGWSPPVPDRLKFLDAYGIGGPGRRGYNQALPSAPMAMKAARSDVSLEGGVEAGRAAAASDELSERDAKDEAKPKRPSEALAPAGPVPPVPLRSDFSETAFWQPHLLAGPDGSATIEFAVPDSVTSWNVWVHAVTRDLRGGSATRQVRTVKELMVRPYLPRFLREGDVAEMKVVLNNAGERELAGSLTLDVLDPETNRSLLAEFGLSGTTAARSFRVKPGGGANETFRLAAPSGVRTVAFKVTAAAGDLSDGELRPLPVLPGRVHLVQSRFVTLKNRDRKTLRFADLARQATEPDPTLVNEQMVVTVDAQLFYTVLKALPYLVNYPYECTEQTLNRFVSTGIVSSLYSDYPAIARMAAEFSKRETPLETFDAADANRKMALEEMPWLAEAKGGRDAGHGLTNVLDPRIASANRDASLLKLRKAQTSSGGFPWWPGGPPSPYMTLYILHGFAKAIEFGVEVPKDVVQRAWGYAADHYRTEWRKCMARGGCWEFVTFLNYVASSFPDDSWSAGALTPAERKEILDFSFKHWRQHSPYLKGYLALTLKRMGRGNDARLVWASVMDSAKTNDEEGTFWATEDRSWLWYNDTIETHAFALRTLMELFPGDGRTDGLVQWLLLHKKLNQWKSTRATAEVVYSLVHYLKREGALGIPEDATVVVGNRKVTFTFEPDRYTGEKNQIVIPGAQVDPKTASAVVVEKESKGFAFASATWSFSTERLPAEDRGDFFSVSRRYFRRENRGREFVLAPLAEGAALAPGDEVEVQLSLRTKHEAEYVHLRDPRAAGLEPVSAASRWKWDLGLGFYEEVRDSATNFFLERLPVGEYTFRYRLRANMAGTFRVSPATVQSMYAPEFNAYSAGAVLTIAPR